jgi:hypothetical protein
MMGTQRFVCRRWFLLAAVSGLGLALPAALSQQADDAVIVRRVWLDPERVPTAMKQVRLGVLKQLSSDDFDNLIRRSRVAAAALKEPPRLIEARYRATLIDTALVGTGQWTVHNPGPGGRILALDPLNLAARQPRFENRDALLADLEGAKPGLLLDERGRHSVALDWTARGDSGPDGLRFDLKTPACAIASLEVNLPRDRALSVSPDGCLMSGPHTAEAADRRLWRVGFAGKSQIYLTIRRTQADVSGPPLFLARTHAVQELTPDGVRATFTLDVKAPRQRTRELRLECDPALQPYEISSHGVERWEVRAGATGNSPAVLTVHYREPWRGGGVTIVCLAPLPSRWTSPRLTLVNAVSRGESLELRVHPDVHLKDWRQGDFLLTTAATQADGTQVLTLAGGGIQSDRTSPARPSAIVETSGVEVLARQRTWWQVRPRMSSLTTQIAYEVARGQLMHLSLALPPRWNVDRVELTPADLLRDWEVRQENGPKLIVHLRKPLKPATDGRQTRLSLRLTSSQPGAATEWTFPDVRPLEAGILDGALAITFDEQGYGPRITATVPSAGLPSGEEGPWGKIPDLYYPYFGKAVAGTLRLQPRTPRVSARCTSEAVLAGGRAAFVAHLELQPEFGSPDKLDLEVSAAVADKWQWKTVEGDNQVRTFEPLPTAAQLGHLTVLGAPPGLGMAIAARSAADRAVSERGPLTVTRWRLTLARPLREPLRLDATCELRHWGDDDRLDVPLLSLPIPNRMEGEVTLYLAGSDTLHVETNGLREAASAGGALPGPRAVSPWRTFRYGAPPASLILHGRASSADLSGAAVFDHAVLTTYVEPSGRLLHHFVFDAWNWKQQTLPVRLGIGSHVLAARVDGRWVSQMPPVEVMEDAWLAKLPVPAAGRPPATSAAASHHFEIAYAQDKPSWRIWTSLETPSSILPVTPVAFRRVWRLPPGVAPLFEDRYRCLPSAAQDRAASGWRVDMPLSGNWSRVPRHWPLAADWEPEQRQRMDEAAAALSKGRDVRPTTLGELLDRLVFEHLKNSEGLILDAVALRDAGLGLNTPVPAAAFEGTSAPWESLGIVYIPCRAAALLATRREADGWRNTARLAGHQADAAPSESVQDAVADAAVQGHDSSGRFVAASHWLRDQGGIPAGNGDSAAESGNMLATLIGMADSDYWTDWEPVAGEQTDQPILVVRRDSLPLGGIVLAVFLCVLFWRLPNGGQPWRLRMMLIWLAATSLGLLWLPAVLRPLAWWPLVGAGMVALAWYLGSMATGQKAEGSKQPPAGIAGGEARMSVPGTPAVLLLILVPAAYFLLPRANGADAPTEYTVFLVPGGADDKPNVLAPPALLDRLNTKARQTPVPGQGAVLASANFEGKMVEGEAEFRADFQVHCFGDQPTNLHLPLEGVRIVDDVLLDGARADVQVAQAPRVGYSIKVEKRSPPLHKVSMRFRVGVKSKGNERDVQFTVPSVMQSRLTFEQPAGARYLQAMAGQTPVRGAQRLNAGPPPRLEADLGRLSSPLHVHWRHAAGPPRPPKAQVKELYLWELRADASTLTSVLTYSITQGEISTFIVNVPERLEVMRVEAEAPSARVPIRLKDWHVDGKGQSRRLEVEIQGPVSGEMRLTLQMAPRGPFAARDALPLPAPRNVQSDLRLVAFRLAGLEATIPEHVGLVVTDPHDFASQWKAAGQAEPRAGWQPSKAYSFDRGASGQPLLQVRLRPAALGARVEQQFTWRIGPSLAEFSATAYVADPNGDLALLEWDVPLDLVITTVRGPDIQSWSKTGSRLQVWLRGSSLKAQVRMTGYRSTTEGRFRLPSLPMLSAASSTTTVRLTAVAGMALTSSELRGLYPLPDPRTGGHELGFITQRPRYGGIFRLVPTSASADARILTIAEVRDRQLTFVAHVDFQMRGRDRRIVVELRNWERGQAELELLDATGTSREEQRGPVRTWTVNVPREQGERCRMILSGKLSVDEPSAGLAMPDVSVSGAARIDRWLAIGAPSELSAEGVRGLKKLTDPAHALDVWWPREAKQLRRAAAPVWKVTADDWNLRLTPRARPAGFGSVRCLLTEEAAAVVDGRHWLHQSTYWLYQDVNSDLQVVLPRGARVLSITLDDRPLATPRLEGGRLRMSLPGNAAVHCLRLRWMLDDDAESLERPLLEPPRLQGVPAGPVLWDVHIPAGYRSDQGVTSAGAAAPASAAGQDLRRAEAQLRLGVLLAERARADTANLDLALAQKRFYRFCRFAERDLDRNPTGDVGPSGESLHEWLHSLRERNGELARRRGFEPLRAEAERQTRRAGDAASLQLNDGDVMPLQGAPTYWRGEAKAVPPQLVLTTARSQKTRGALGGSLLIMVLVLSAWAMARFPSFRGWARLFWPEQMALLGCLGWQLFGLNLLVLFLVLLGVCARSVYLGKGIVRWLSRPAASASPSSVS